MNLQKNKNKGFTMIETIVALAVLTAAIIGPVTLVTRAIFSSSFSRNDLIGYNLAQEGIELIRAVRDNNIHCRNLQIVKTKKWNDNPTSVSSNPMHDAYTVDVEDMIPMNGPCNGIQTPKPVSRLPAACDDPFFPSPIPPLGLDGSGVYTYTGDITIFTRCVKVCSPPTMPPCTSVADTTIPADEQMEVISTVWWRERNQMKSVMLHTRLYHWE